jgi:hypothetical protein
VPHSEHVAHLGVEQHYGFGAAGAGRDLGTARLALRGDRRGQRFALSSTWPTAVQGRFGSVRYRHQVVAAERLAASVAMELIAAGTEHLAASCAGVDFQEDVPAVFVIFDWKAFKERVTCGAGGGVELLSHGLKYALLTIASQE